MSSEAVILRLASSFGRCVGTFNSQSAIETLSGCWPIVAFPVDHTRVSLDAALRA